MEIEEFGKIEHIIESMDLDRGQEEVMEEKDTDISIQNFRADLSSRQEARKQLERNFMEKYKKAQSLIEEIEEDYEDSEQYDKDQNKDGLMDVKWYNKRCEAYNLLYEALINLILSYQIAVDTRDAIKEQTKGMSRIHNEIKGTEKELVNVIEEVQGLATELKETNMKTAKKEDADQIKDRIDNLETRLSNMVFGGEIEEENLECPDCGKKFSGNRALVAHWRTKHPDSDEDIEDYKE